MTVKALREQRAEHAKTIKRLSGLVNRERRDFTPAEFDEWSLANRTYADLTSQIVESEMSNPADTFRTLPGRDDFMPDQFRPRGKSSSPVDLALRGWALNQLGRSIGDEDAEACRSYGISPQSATFEVRLAPHGPRSGRELRAMSAVLLSAGGALVPEGFIPNLEIAMTDFSGILQVAEVMRTTSGNDLPWPTTNDTGNEGALLGESTASTEQNIATGQVVFRALKYTSKLVRVPAELLQDSGVDLPSALGRILGERLARAMNRHWTVGSGGSQPHGIVTAATLGVTAASATAITMDNLLDLTASVDPAYQNPQSGTGFMMSQTVANFVRKLKGGDGHYLWQPSTQASQPATLLGWPVTINNSMTSTIASGEKTVLFGALSKYKVRLAGEVRLRRLVERYADTDEEGFVAFARCDGTLLDAGTRPVKYLTH